MSKQSKLQQKARRLAIKRATQNIVWNTPVQQRSRRGRIRLGMLAAFWMAVLGTVLYVANTQDLSDEAQAYMSAVKSMAPTLVAADE